MHGVTRFTLDGLLKQNILLDIVERMFLFNLNIKLRKSDFFTSTKPAKVTLLNIKQCQKYFVQKTQWAISFIFLIYILKKNE